MGETFAPVLHTGTGNFTIPIAVPPGRNGFQPQLNLTYSTGNGNGLFGLGWAISLPGIVRKTSKGIPRYRDLDPDLRKHDVFLLSGAEDLVPTDATLNAYRPRVEGLFADIRHHIDAEARSNYWEVRSKDGLSTYYGTNPEDAPAYPQSPGPYSDNAVIAKEKQSPTDRSRIFAWKITLPRTHSGTESNICTNRETNRRAQSRGLGILGISRC